MSPSGAEHHLLLGLLALQFRLVTREQLLAAATAWLADRERSLGAILLDQGALAADNLAWLEALTRRHLETSPDAVSTVGPPGDTGVTADPHATTPHGGAPLTPAAEGYKPAASSRYVVLRPHARGGLGEVFVARDTELSREVALKEIQGQHADDPVIVARFLAEAEITGALEHPGIVPVYGLGRYADGRPYYAMRFVRGDSLKNAIDSFHRAKTTGAPDASLLELRQLLRRFLDVCNAVEYAHSRGVIHRDLKPSNILVGEYGETLVVDWGLAKATRQEDKPDSTFLTPPSSFDETQAGTVLGTPAYMSPEQAAGRLDLVGPRGDVYSLGATLYHLLTGQAPFTGGGVPEVLARVQQGEFPRPRELARELAPALEAVCLKAMALRPEERYASARALAGDVDRWLADEPVSAYREPWPRRLARWRRRHATFVTAGALVILTLAVSAGVGAMLIGREGARARALGQVEALQDAAAPTVPLFLKELETCRADALARLREKWHDEELSDPRRLRIGLALADDAEVRTRLVPLARKADDPQEVLLVRDALRPYAAEMSAGLWDQLKEPGTPAAERFRLLAILAALDQEGAGWPAVAEEAVAQFLEANLLHLGLWKSAFQPACAALLPPLARAFRAADLDRRQRAAALVADYAAQHPDVLADLLPDADERQFFVLWPKVQAQREGIIPLLERSLDQVPATDWPHVPLDPSWEAPGAEAVRRIEAAGGMIAERFALCQTLPLEKFELLAEGLRKSGYRPAQFRPFTDGRQLRVAALWVRDGVEARWASGLSMEDLAAQDKDWRGRGFVPRDTTGYLLDRGALPPEDRYAALWSRKGPGVDDGRLYAGLTSEARRRVIAAFQQSGLRPRTQSYIVVGGEARHTGVWGKSSSTAEEVAARLGVTRDDYEAAASPSYVQTDSRLMWNPVRLERGREQAVGLMGAAPAGNLAGVPWGVMLTAGSFLNTDPLGVDHAAVWHHSGDHLSQELHALDPATHLARCRELTAQGARPESLSVVSAGGPLVAASVWHRPAISEATKDALAQRQAQAAVVLLQLGAPERVWPLLDPRPDPRLRSFLIHRFVPLRTEVSILLHRLETERDDPRRRLLVLALGQYGPQALDPGVRAEWLDRLRRWYTEEPDPGLHGAVEWLLRRWGDRNEVVRLELELAKRGLPEPPRRWYVNGRGQTLMVVHAGAEFWMGSPANERGRVGPNEALHRVRIPRQFAIAAKEVRVEQFLRFRPEHRYLSQNSPQPDGAMVSVSWYDAAAYCNWLSEREKIPPEEWCYVPAKTGTAGELQPAPDHLHRIGYRLPTEAEWECAVRAGTTTARHYGHAEELLKEYAWAGLYSDAEGVRSGGLLKPNDLGLFDVYGNVAEWCQDVPATYRWGRRGEAIEDRELGAGAWAQPLRTLRGGALTYPTTAVRSAARNANRPDNPLSTAGFRIARTMP
jgi:formylglycine-generating enzyme required for sulfatase activity/tRNA A-37 threonylcarbamoyl transferase component Bud32